MTQTLTTERLREIASSPSFSANPLSHEVKYMARELLATREAQPVAWDYEWASCITCDGPQNFKHVIEREAPPKWAIDEGQARNVTPLYTIPPAPAVPRVTEIPEAATLTNINQLCPLDNNLSQTDFATGWNDCRQYALTHDGLPPVIKGVHAAAQGWNACRAAMLAQPVSGGYTLNSPEIPDGWIACSEQMPDDEQECLVQTHSGFRYVSFYDEHTGLFYDMPGGNQVDCVEHILVTHWMPLPPVPGVVK